MKILAKHQIHHGKLVVKAGQEVDFSEEDAKFLISRGAAVEVKPLKKEVETTVPPIGESDENDSKTGSENIDPMGGTEGGNKDAKVNVEGSSTEDSDPSKDAGGNGESSDPFDDEDEDSDPPKDAEGGEDKKEKAPQEKGNKKNKENKENKK